MAVKNGKKMTAFPGLDVITRDSVRDAIIRFDQVDTAPTTTSGHRYLYVNSSDQLIFDDGSTTLNLSTVASGGTTLDSAYDAGASITVDVSTITLTQTLNDTGINLNKTGTGAGVPLLIQNAGTGDDFRVITTRATATGSVWEAYHNSASPADNDVLWEMQIHGNDDGAADTEYARLRFRSTDVTDTTEDADFTLNLFVGGTARDCFSVAGSTVTIGDNNSAATLTSGGNFDLVLQTGNATTGSMTITDGANGNIQIAPDGTGILDLNSGFDIDASSTETCTITVVGTTGDGLAIDSSTITSGAVVMINHSASATLSGGQLLDLQIDGTSYYAFGEVALTIAGTAGSTILSVTAGDAVFSDGSLAITDADNANSFSVTNNTATTASVVEIAGSGVFTGTTTGSFMEVSASGLTSGTLLRLVAAAADTSVGVVDIATTALTSGSSLRITESTANFTTGGKAIEVDFVAATAGNGLTVTTTGAYTGTGMVLLTAGAATTGILLSLVSTTGMTSGSLFRATSSTAGAVATNGVISIRATGAFTSTSNVGYVDVLASATTAGTVCRIASSAAGQTTAELLRVEASGYTTGYTGSVMSVIGVGTTGAGNVLQITSAQTSAGNGINIDSNGLTTGGVGLNISHTTSVIGAGSSMLRITSTGSDTGTTTGCLVDLASSAATAGTLVLVTSATMATGSGMVMALAGLTTGVGLSMTHATAVIANGGSMFRLNSGGIDTATTSGCLVDLTSTASTAGTQVLMTFSGLTTGVGMRMVGNAITSGIMIDLENSDAGFTGNYIRCFDGAAVDFSVGEDGRVVLAGAAGISAIAVTAGDVTTADGAFASAVESVTCGAAAATFAVDSNVVRVTGDAGGNTITTITGGVAGQIVTLIFEDALVTINDDNTHGADSIDLVGANTTFADDAVLTLVYAAGSWYEVSRSVND